MRIKLRQIKDRRAESYLFKLCLEFIEQHNFFRGVVLNDVVLSSGGQDAKLLVLFEKSNETAEAALRRLNEKTGQVRSWVAKHWSGKNVPKFKFVLDKGALNAKNVAKILEDLARKEE